MIEGSLIDPWGMWKGSVIIMRNRGALANQSGPKRHVMFSTSAAQANFKFKVHTHKQTQKKKKQSQFNSDLQLDRQIPGFE